MDRSPFRHLTAREKNLLGPYIPQIDLQNAVLRVGRVPWYLGKRFRAITRGNRIFFREGTYDPDTVDGIALLGHELVHVGQYRRGMNWFKYLWSARHGYYSCQHEKEAFALQRKIRKELSAADIRSDRCDSSV